MPSNGMLLEKSAGSVFSGPVVSFIHSASVLEFLSCWNHVELSVLGWR